MPSWKKVIVSGSDASLSSLYTSGNITGSNILVTGTVSGSTFSGSFVGDASGLTGIALSGSMSSTGSFGELEVTTDLAQGTGSFDHVKSTPFEGYGGDWSGIMTVEGFENAVVLTSDGSEDITILNMVFITDNAGDIVTWQ